MAQARRRRITEPEALEALAHPVRLELIVHLMAEGPATASACARAVGDTPSNCSYHLRRLADVGLVADAASDDGRERPWRALVTGFDTDVDGEGPMTPQAEQLFAVLLQRDERVLREYVARRARAPKRWRDADMFSTYALRMSPLELSELTARMDDLIRPYVAATREDAPRGSALVHLGVRAFPTDVAP
jgi:DNA-binding transcriptional ArsR family regulator